MDSSCRDRSQPNSRPPQATIALVVAMVALVLTLARNAGLVIGDASATAAPQRDAAPPPVRATAFELVDAKGSVRAVLRCGKDTGPRLDFLDARGGTRATIGLAYELGVAPEQAESTLGAFLEFQDANRKPAISLAAASNLRQLALHDFSGQERVMVKTGQYGAPFLTGTEISLLNGDGSKPLTIGTNPGSLPMPSDRANPPQDPTAIQMKDAAYLRFTTPENRTAFQVQEWLGGVTSIDVWDREGKPLWSVPTPK